MRFVVGPPGVIGVLNAVSGGGHDARCGAHSLADGRRQIDATGLVRVTAMADFIPAHLDDDGVRAGVLLGQFIEMAIEVMLDPVFGLCDEAETDFIAEASGKRADRESAGISQRVQQARTIVQFLQALGAPGEAVLFFARGSVELDPDGRILGKQRLPLV